MKAAPPTVAPTGGPFGTASMDVEPRTEAAQTPDGELAIRVRLRDEVAFAELFSRHRRGVAAAARSVLGDDHRLDDVVAEVFLGLWVVPEQFDPARCSLSAFLRVKARGKSIDLVRAEAARSRRERGTPHERPIETDSGLIASESAQRLRRALSELRPEQREPIELAFFGEMSHKAIAAHLGLAEGTVKSRIRRGLANLYHHCAPLAD